MDPHRKHGITPSPSLHRPCADITTSQQRTHPILISQQQRKTTHTRDGLPDYPRPRPKSRMQPNYQPTHLSAFLCNPPGRRRRRPTSCASHARARKHYYHRNIYPPRHPIPPANDTRISPHQQAKTISFPYGTPSPHCRYSCW